MKHLRTDLPPVLGDGAEVGFHLLALGFQESDLLGDNVWVRDSLQLGLAEDWQFFRGFIFYGVQRQLRDLKFNPITSNP